MKKKIYYIQPTYRDSNGKLFKGKSLHVHSLAIPALSAATPEGWEKEISIEYFENLNFGSDASVIAITSMGYDIVRGMEIAEEFRKRGKIVIFGGYQSNFSSKYLFDHCDSVVHGNPGPKHMSIILSEAEERILKREYYCGIDVNFPFDYSVLAGRKISFMPVLSSVGCANDCDFCCTAAIYGGCYRLRKVEYVMQDLLTVNKLTRKAGFVDNNIYNNREYLLILLKEMIQKKISLLWGAQATVNIGDDTEALHYLYKSGCRVLFIGMESVNQKNLDEVNKKFVAEDYRKKIKNVHNSGIKIAAYFMFGLENDTKETLNDIYRFVNLTGIEIPLLNFLTPAPGTRVYDRLKSEGRLLFHDDKELLSKKHFYNSACNTCFFIPRFMTPEEAEKSFLELYRKLAGYFQILKRSANLNPFMMAFLLGMNIVFRSEYLSMKKKNRGVIPEQQQSYPALNTFNGAATVQT
jgi:radical SAM superfamily enzyme YgiQ (UPF0313 family)